jgi:mannose/fructose/N-acetylgalactosamine-specific phosphotransferase system component IIC
VNVPFYLEEIVLLALFGGLLAVDERVGWQSTLSQPVMSGPIVGLILGDFVTGATVGVVLELVWLSVLPMRGTRKPDAVTGSIVGAGAACLLAKHTGDPRFAFMAALGVFLGLVSGEFAGGLIRWLHRARERRLGRFDVPPDDRALQRKLLFYFFYSVCFVFAAEAVVVLIKLLPSVLVADWMTGSVSRQFAAGAEWWVAVVPTLGAGALVQMYWHKQHNRYLALCAGIVLILLWFK